MRRMKTFQFQERPRQSSNSSIVWKPDDFTSLLENSNNLPKVGIGELSGLAEAPELAEQASIARSNLQKFIEQALQIHTFFLMVRSWVP